MQSVELILSELSPRLSQLERQARRAREHAALAAELAAALTRWFALRLVSAQGALDAATATHAQRVAEAGAAAALAATSEAQRETARQQLAAVRGREQAALATLRQREDSLREARQQLRIEEERLVFVRRRVSDLEQEVAAIRVERAETAADLPGGSGDLPERIAASRRLLDQRQEELELHDREHAGAAAALARADGEGRRLRGDLREAEERLARLERRREDARRDAATRRERRRTLLVRLAEAAQRFARQRAITAAAEAALAAAATTHAECRDEFERARESARSVERSVGDRTVLAALARRVENLRRQAAQAAGDAQAKLHAWLADSAKASGADVRGELAHGLRIEAGQEAAVSALLGDAAGALLLADLQGLDRVVEAVRADAAHRPPGRLSLAAISGHSPEHPHEAAYATLPSGLRLAGTVVDGDEPYRSVARRLLHGCGLALTVEAARAGLAYGLSVIALPDGTLMHASGFVLGGDVAISANRFAITRELEAAAAELRTAQAEADAAALHLTPLRQAANDAQQALHRAEQALDASQRDARRQSDALAAARAALNPPAADLRHLRATAVSTQGLADTLTAQVGGLQERVLAARRAYQFAEHQAGALRATDVATKQQRATLERTISEARGGLNALEREAESFKALAERRRQALARIDERQAARARELAARNGEIAATEQALAGMRAAVSAEESRLQEAIAAVALPRDQAATLTRDLDALDGRLVAERRAQNEAERAALTADHDLQGRRRDLDRLLEEIEAEGLQLDHSTLRDQPPPETQQETALEAEQSGLEARVKSLRSRIRAQGPVNPHAAAEHDEAKARHDHLTTQLADLRAAEQDVEVALEELRVLVRSRFADAFVRINADFERFFTTFFGGGAANLELAGEGGDDAGVEIMARPPGKRLQSLSLLSGGERSMTAVALLFALLESNPAPFCVLDEVDAALDESNVVRFGGALQDMAQRTQFIVITHNRGTIETAGTIYGVSMGRDGASTVLSLRIGDVPFEE